MTEVFLYAIYLRKVTEARVLEKNVSERKILVGEVGAESDTAMNVPGDRQKEEIIWGRGLNGGIRRRVREKWHRKDNEGQGKE